MKKVWLVYRHYGNDEGDWRDVIDVWEDDATGIGMTAAALQALELNEQNKCPSTDYYIESRLTKPRKGDKMARIYADVRILGGFPVRATGYVQPAEPDVGIFSAYVEDISFTVKGKPAPWLEEKMTPKDWEKLEEDLTEAMYDR